MKQPGPTRELPKVGLAFRVLIPEQWNADIFAGICIANGCEFAMAKNIAAQLGKAGARMTTVRPLKDMEQFRVACLTVGVLASEIEPL